MIWAVMAPIFWWAWVALCHVGWCKSGWLSKCIWLTNKTSWPLDPCSCPIHHIFHCIIDVNDIYQIPYNITDLKQLHVYVNSTLSRSEDLRMQDGVQKSECDEENNFMFTWLILKGHTFALSLLPSCVPNYNLTSFYFAPFIKVTTVKWQLRLWEVLQICFNTIIITMRVF